MNTTENNKLIAEFMGVGELYEAQSSNQWNQYHTSWNSLMPVVGKISRDEKFFENEYRENLLDVVPYGRIQDVFEAVVEFINQYNKTKHNEHNRKQ